MQNFIYKKEKVCVVLFKEKPILKSSKVVGFHLASDSHKVLCLGFIKSKIVKQWMTSVRFLMSLPLKVFLLVTKPYSWVKSTLASTRVITNTISTLIMRNIRCFDTSEWCCNSKCLWKVHKHIIRRNSGHTQQAVTLHCPFFSFLFFFLLLFNPLGGCFMRNPTSKGRRLLWMRVTSRLLTRSALQKSSKRMNRMREKSTTETQMMSKRRPSQPGGSSSDPYEEQWG